MTSSYLRLFLSGAGILGISPKTLGCPLTLWSARPDLTTPQGGALHKPQKRPLYPPMPNRCAGLLASGNSRQHLTPKQPGPLHFGTFL